MIGTLLLSLTMGIGRAILPVVDIESARMLSAVEFVNPELLIIVTIYGFVRLLVMLPCIWISLGKKSDKIISRMGISDDIDFGDSKIKDVKLHVSEKPGFAMKLLGELDPALELRSPNIDIQSDQRMAKHLRHLLNR
ncbi:MAG: hypothetical protein OSA89_20215 [Mariniblastus sp.]|nr:hypothetical protein [Mariniblastus sp.]